MTVTIAHIQDWLFAGALPLWYAAGRDGRHGGFFDRLDFDGAPIADAPKRLRVQARQTYVYSHAHLLGWEPDGGAALDAARDGFDFMTRHYWRADTGGFAFSVQHDCTPADKRVEAYEQAFALFACAWYLRASGEAAAREWAARILEFMDDRLADPVHGGYLENLSGDLPRRQNPHMHLLEALLAMHAATGEDDFLNRARVIVGLFREKFFDTDSGTLGEFFDEAWNPAPGTAGTIVEPGHHFEWTWLLHRYGQASGEDISHLAAGLYHFAETHGTDHASGAAQGLAFDSVLKNGADLDDDKRLWVQTEALKAQIAQIEAGAGQAAAERRDRLLDHLFAHYLLPNGAWRDHLHRDGEPFGDHAPASSLYHIFLALSEALRGDGGPSIGA